MRQLEQPYVAAQYRRLFTGRVSHDLFGDSLVQVGDCDGVFVELGIRQGCEEVVCEETVAERGVFSRHMVVFAGRHHDPSDAEAQVGERRRARTARSSASRFEDRTGKRASAALAGEAAI